MRTRLLQPLASVPGDPVLRNGYALIVSATVTQVLGVRYWSRLVYDSHIYC
jgi:hypothetical protein